MSWVACQNRWICDNCINLHVYFNNENNLNLSWRYSLQSFIIVVIYSSKLEIEYLRKFKNWVELAFSKKKTICIHKTPMWPYSSLFTSNRAIIWILRPSVNQTNKLTSKSHKLFRIQTYINVAISIGSATKRHKSNTGEITCYIHCIMMLFSSPFTRYMSTILIP